MSTSPTPLAEVAHAADLLGEVAWDEVAPTELVRAAAGLARARAQLDAALVAVAGRLAAPEAAGAWGDQGWASAKDFLTHVTGGRKGAGGGLVRAAEQTAELPVLREAMAAGAISLAQARVIGARVATLPRVPGLREEATGRLLDLAVTGGCDATEVDRAFGGLLAELDPDGELRGAEQDLDKKERAAHAGRFLSFAEDALGGVRIRGYATAEEAEVVKATLHPLAAPVSTEPGACGGDPRESGGSRRDEQGRRVGHGCPDRACAHDGRDSRDHGARMWDALVEACRRLQGGDALPHAHGTTARVTVTIDHADLRERLAGQGLLPGGGSLSAAAVRRLACDAEIIAAVLGGEGQVLDVGRAQRLVTTAIWLALVLRDRHCAFPGCDRLPIACDAHHIVHWADGGPTSLDNLVLLCRRHHTLTHATPWSVHLDPVTRRPVWTPPPPVDDRARFTYHPPNRPPETRPPPSRAA